MSKARGLQNTSKASRNRWHADRALAMWGCVIHNLADIHYMEVRALEELPSDDEFVAKLKHAEEILGQIRDIVDVPRDR
jgi:hypothetical protein